MRPPASVMTLWLLAAGCQQPRMSPNDGGTRDQSTADCTNRVKDGDETDVDCGGASCQTCGGGAMCLRGTDCTFGQCLNNVCLSPQLADLVTWDSPLSGCSNAVQDGTETDVDCGGATCPTCGIGRRCQGPPDCQSATCINGRCAAGTPLTLQFGSMATYTTGGGSYSVTVGDATGDGWVDLVVPEYFAD